MNNYKKNQRRKFLIDPKFQLSLLGMCFLLALFILGMWLISGQIVFWEFMQKGQELQLPSDHIYFRFIETQRRKMNVVIACVGCLTTLGIMFAGLKISNKIIGPLYNLRKNLKEIRETKKVGRPISFRENDYFIELAEDVNATFVALGHRFETLPEKEKK
jgi:uncharacterized membrane protein YciS (DUF1049 family)